MDSVNRHLSTSAKTFSITGTSAFTRENAWSISRRGCAGLRAFKHAYTEMQKKGGTLSAKNAGEVVQDVLKVTGFARLFKMI